MINYSFLFSYSEVSCSYTWKRQHSQSRQLGQGHVTQQFAILLRANPLALFYLTSETLKHCK